MFPTVLERQLVRGKFGYQFVLQRLSQAELTQSSTANAMAMQTIRRPLQLASQLQRNFVSLEFDLQVTNATNR